METQDFLIVGNWKMNKTKAEVNAFLEDIGKHDFGNKNTVVIIPPSPYLYLFEEKLRYLKIQYGVQNFYPTDEGAFTGEISSKMMLDFGCKYAIVGHSERRTIFMECDEFVSKKVKACVKTNIKPIMCIGENLDLRKSGNYKNHLIQQMKTGLSLISGKDLMQVVIAYEPIWAIGTGENATPEQVEEAHLFIRDYLVSTYGEEIGKSIPLLYGGSVKPNNIKDIALAQAVNGFLIGGASLDAKSFIEMNDILNGK